VNKTREFKPLSKEDLNNPDRFYCALEDRIFPVKKLPCVRNPYKHCENKSCREQVKSLLYQLRERLGNE